MISFFYSHYTDPYPTACIIVMTIAGFFCLLGFVLLNLAILSGKGALAVAVCQTQSFFWLLLDMVLLLRYPHFYEVLAIALGVAGAAIITFAKK